jgi:hypothetical protein
MRHTGLTLAEIAISVFIMGFLLAGVIAVLSLGDRAWHSDMALVELQQQVRSTMRQMVTELRQSNTNSINIDQNGRRVIFTIPEIANNIRYYLNGTEVVREHPLGTPMILMGDVDSLNFCCWNGVVCNSNCATSNLLEIRLQATKTLLSEAHTIPIREQVRLRNE